MLNDKLENNRKNAVKLYGVFIIITIALMFLFLALFSAISVIFSIDSALTPVFSSLSMCLATLIGSFLAGKTFGGKALIVGAVNGILLYLLVSVVAAILNSGKLTFSSLFNFLIIMLSSVIGAVFGVNAAGKRKMK